MNINISILSVFQLWCLKYYAIPTGIDAAVLFECIVEWYHVDILVCTEFSTVTMGHFKCHKSEQKSFILLCKGHILINL